MVSKQGYCKAMIPSAKYESKNNSEYFILKIPNNYFNYKKINIETEREYMGWPHYIPYTRIKYLHMQDIVSTSCVHILRNATHTGTEK